jgi:hypothetical protein
LPQPVNFQTLVAGLHDDPGIWKFNRRLFIKFPFFWLFQCYFSSIPFISRSLPQPVNFLNARSWSPWCPRVLKI